MGQQQKASSPSSESDKQRQEADPLGWDMSLDPHDSTASKPPGRITKGAVRKNWGKQKNDQLEISKALDNSIPPEQLEFPGADVNFDLNLIPLEEIESIIKDIKLKESDFALPENVARRE